LPRPLVLALALAATAARPSADLTCPEGSTLHTFPRPDGSTSRTCLRKTGRDGLEQHGPFAELDARGRVTQLGEARDGRVLSLTTFHPNGRRAEAGPVQNGMRHGDWTRWSETGEVVAREHYAHDRRVRQEGRAVLSFTGDDDVVGHLRRAPHVAVVRMVACHATEPPRAMLPQDALFEVVETVRGTPGARVFVHQLSGCPLEVGAVAIASVAPRRQRRPVPWGSGRGAMRDEGPWVDGAVTAVLQVPGLEQAREDVRRLKLAR
jgi:hypothetical protein